jgi:hypothetical membrane protein
MDNPASVSETRFSPSLEGGKIWRTVTRYAGVTAIPVYALCTLISALHKPSFGPLTNWLSDYGNPQLNPGGALWYNAGCIAVAALLALFYLGLAQWYRGRRAEKKYVICYICAQITGIAATACLVMASVIPLGVNDAAHSIFSLLNMIGMDCFLSFTAVAFFLHSQMPKALAVFGYAAAVFNIVCQNAFAEFFLGEWIFFLLFMAYIAIVTARYGVLARCDAKAA